MPLLGKVSRLTPLLNVIREDILMQNAYHEQLMGTKMMFHKENSHSIEIY